MSLLLLVLDMSFRPLRQFIISKRVRFHGNSSLSNQISGSSSSPYSSAPHGSLRTRCSSFEGWKSTLTELGYHVSPCYPRLRRSTHTPTTSRRHTVRSASSTHCHGKSSVHRNTIRTSRREHSGLALKCLYLHLSLGTR